MRKRKIHYIGWYIDESESNQYSGNIPGMLKMRYVLSMLTSLDKQIIVLSLASKSKNGFYKSKSVCRDNITIKYIGGFNGKGKLFSIINRLIKQLLFVSYVVFSVGRRDIIVLYHSVSYTKLLSRLKRVINRYTIIEVEEVYGYSATCDRKWVQSEIAAIKQMDAFIVVNDGMIRTLNLPIERCVVSYGVGNIPERTIPRKEDGKIHVVYAGTIEARKRGAYTAAETAAFLPSNYIMHIIGFGNVDNVTRLNDIIKRINRAAGIVKVQYDGFFSGNDLDRFLFQCHIGLSSNVMRPNFANHSFPSKVITYMCHDLSVVLGYADAFYDVPISKGWQFYRCFEPEEIAKAITRTEVKPVGAYHEQIEQMNEDLLSFLKRYCS